MNVLKNRALTLLATLAVAGAACQGEKGPAGSAGTNGTNGTNVGALTTSGLVIAVKGVTINPDQSVSVEFTVKDDQGYAVDLAGKYSTNAVFNPRFSLSKVNVAADGTVLPYSVLTKTGSATFAPDAAPADDSAIKYTPTATAAANPAVPQTTGVLVDTGSNAGDYIYTFATGGFADAPATGANVGKTTRTYAKPVLVDPKSTDTYVVWIEAARQIDTTPGSTNAKTFQAVNKSYAFIPAGGTPNERQIAATSGCNNCHRGFRPQGSSTKNKTFHGGTRVEAAYCNVCHNPDHGGTLTTSDGATSAAASGIFVHRIHASANLLRDTTTTSMQSGYQENGTSCSTTKPCDCTKSACVPNSFHGISEVTYPQDIRNCGICHADAKQGAQAKTVASRAVCGSCHDYVVFDPTAIANANPALPACVAQDGTQAKDVNGNWLKCAHAAGANTDDNSCKGCHVQGGAGFIGDFHLAVADVDPGNIFAPVTSGTATAGYQGGTLQNCATTTCVCTPAAPCYDPVGLSLKTANATSGSLLVNGTACGTGHKPSLYGSCTCTPTAPCLGAGNNNTNAANLAAAGAVPAGASTFKYVIKSASLSGSNPVIVFKIQKDGQDKAFDHCTAAAATPAAGNNELYDGFVGSPSLYFVWAVPQDGIAAPADFNMSANVYLRTVCNDGGTSKTKIAGPDANGYYTVTLTGTTVTSNAVMLTAGVGYTYGLTATQPLTQINLPAYPYVAATKQGGLTVPAENVSLVAAKFTARRAIIDNAKCKACHTQLGVAPTFHAGQRNDGASCSWCHTPNKTSSGWAANSKDFIHAIHAGEDRAVAFNWHAESPTQNFGEVTFPGPLNNCEACHVPGSYDFSAAASAAALPNLLPSYAAVGTFNNSDTGSNFAVSPYVTMVTDATYPDPRAPTYGFGFATSAVKVTINDGTTQTTAAFTQSVNGTDTKCDAVASPGCVCTVANPCTYTVKTCSATAPCDADANSLVNSPITAACVACHDSSAAKGHMVGNGGLFYAPHSQVTYQAQAQIGESCLLCHGADGIAPIAEVHK